MEMNNDRIPPKLSPSAEAGDGCLAAIAKFFVVLLIIAVLPVLIPLLMFWWIFAWIFGHIFPGKEFFPIKRIYNSVSKWFERHLGEPLGDYLVMAVFAIIAFALIDGISNLFSNKREDTN